MGGMCHNGDEAPDQHGIHDAKIVYRAEKKLEVLNQAFGTTLVHFSEKSTIYFASSCGYRNGNRHSIIGTVP